MAITPLNALHAFLTVARHKSFAAAAVELAISPSALSQSVRQLEARLGVSLLRRTTRSVALTDVGRRLYERTAPSIGDALAAMKSVHARPGELIGRLRLSAPHIAVPFAVAPVMQRFVGRHPHVEIDLQVDDRLVDIVADGFDAGVRLEEFVERDMVRVRLSPPARFVIVAAPAYLKRRGKPSAPQDLLEHDCIMYRSPTTNAPYVWELERGRRTWRIPPRGTVTSNNHPFILAMAEAGFGLAYVFEPQVAEALARGALQVVLEDYAASVPGLFLYYPSRAQASPTLRALVETTRSQS